MIETYRSPPCNVEGYIAYCVHYDTGKKTTVLQHREVMEKHVGRKLLSTEIVHHKDEDKHNNSIDNLEILSPSAHAKHHAEHVPPITLTCVFCKNDFQRSGSQEKHNRSQGKFGPFCGKSCSAKYFIYTGRIKPGGKTMIFTKESIDLVRKRIANGESKSSIARELGIDRTSIYYNLNNPKFVN